MQKVGTEAYWSPQAYPATIGRFLPSNLSANRCTAGCPLRDRIAGASSPAESEFGCGKGARGEPWAEPGRPDLGPNHARFCSSPRAVLSFRLKLRHGPATFANKAGSARNLCHGPSVSQSMAASPDAELEMPTIYTRSDFVLIRLHRRHAGTISESVTSRKRVGRSMSQCVTTQERR